MKSISIVYPFNNYSVIGSMAGKYTDRVTKCDDLESAKEIAMIDQTGEKFDGKLSFDKDVNKKC